MPRVTYEQKLWPNRDELLKAAAVVTGHGEVYGALEEPPGNIALVIFCEVANTWRIVPLAYCRPEAHP